MFMFTFCRYVKCNDSAVTDKNVGLFDLHLSYSKLSEAEAVTSLKSSFLLFILLLLLPRKFKPNF
jgi:hypothetical protein